MKYIFKHTVVTRVMHGIHLISMVLLILSGFYIYAPDSFRIFPSMDAARYVHFIFMYFIGWTLVYKFYYSIVTGEIKELIFTWKDAKELPKLIKLPLEINIIDVADFDSYHVKESFLILREKNLEGSEILAGQLGLDPNRSVFEPIENNTRTISATLVLGEDFEMILKRQNNKET